MDKEKSKEMNIISVAGRLPDLAQAWQALQAVTPVRPIHNEQEYDRAVKLADSLADEVGDNASHPLYSLFDLIMDFIARWEGEHIKLPDAEPKEVLRFLLETNGLKQKDLENDGIASQTLVSDVLAGRREISKRLAKALAERFNVAVAAFI